MRVLLMQPTLTCRWAETAERPTMYEPLGLGYLAAAVRERGHEPLVLDCLAEGWRVRQQDGELTRLGLRDDDIESRIRDFHPGLVGISCMFTGFDRDCTRLASIVKRVNRDIPVVVGGAHASALPETLIEEPNIDLVVRSEGEAVFLALLDCLERDGAVPDGLPGTATQNRANPLAELIPDLDALPFPARDLLPMDIYLEDQREIMPYAKRRPIGFMISSRGCPFNCIFCSTTKIWRRWRPRSPKNIVDEIEVLVNDYGCREIAFLDDSFLADKRRVLSFCNELKRRNIDISWNVPTGLTVWTVTEGILRAMVETGFYRACFPIESGDPELLKYIRKPVDLDRVVETIGMCHRLGLWTYGNFIIGFPEQTPESIEMTIRYGEACGLDMLNVYVLQPYAGSDLYDVMCSSGLQGKANADASTIHYTMFDTKYFTAEQLRAKRDEFYKRFTKARLKRLLTPKGLNDLRRKMNSPERFRYAMRVFATFAKYSLKSKKFTIIPE